MKPEYPPANFENLIKKIDKTNNEIKEILKKDLDLIHERIIELETTISERFW